MNGIYVNLLDFSKLLNDFSLWSLQFQEDLLVNYTRKLYTSIYAVFIKMITRLIQCFFTPI